MVHIQLSRFTFTFGLTRKAANIVDDAHALPAKVALERAAIFASAEKNEPEPALPWIEDCDKKLDLITKQAIFTKLKKWIVTGMVYPSNLFEVRDITHEFLTNQKKSLNQNYFEIPSELERAKDLSLTEFQPKDRRSILQAALRFVGINDSNGPSTIGELNWNEIKQLVEQVSC